MSMVVWVGAKTLDYPRGGGHLWVYLNWAMSFRALGFDVVWLEAARPRDPNVAQQNLQLLRHHLSQYGFEKIATCWNFSSDLLSLDNIQSTDLLVNIAFDVPPEVVSRFRNSALIDIDPGLTQVWISKGEMHLAEHTAYFSIGETVGKSDAKFSSCGINWQYIPPAVFLDAWPVEEGRPSGSYTTVTHWWGALMEFDGSSYYNGKRAGFLPYHELGRLSGEKLEIAVSLEDDPTRDRELFEQGGWRFADPYAAADTPEKYRKYVADSKGEFSCAKPSCLYLQNAWISDRTICYLASGRPAVVQHTGKSKFLPDSAGLFRFTDQAGALQAFRTINEDYPLQCQKARALAEEHFDGVRAAKKLLENVL